MTFPPTSSLARALVCILRPGLTRLLLLPVVTLQGASHPHPQLARTDWQPLSPAPWAFVLNPPEEAAATLPAGDRGGFPQIIHLPFAWTSRASGIAAPGATGTGWYRTTFTVPPQWRARGQRVRLHVGRADYQTTAWLNGQAVGQHEGGYTPFAFDLTDALQPGDSTQVLVVRVVDEDDDTQPSGRQGELTPLAGLWGDVWIESAPADRLVSVTAVSVLVDLATVDAEFEIIAEGAALTGAPAAGWPRVQTRRPGLTLVKWELPWTEAAAASPWRPDQPTVHDLTVTLRPVEETADTTADVVHTYLAAGPRPHAQPVDDPLFRHYFVDDTQVPVRGAGYSMWWPESLGTPPDDDALRRDLEAARGFGLNALRLQQTLPTPRLVELADRLGVILMVDLPASRAIAMKRRTDHREAWGSNLAGVREDWYYVRPWDDQLLAFARTFRQAPSLWFVRLWPQRLPIGDAGRGEELLHWQHWRWHNVTSWTGAMAVEWPRNSGRCLQPDWWDLTLETRDPAAARLSLQHQLGTERYRLFEAEDVARTDQRIETVILSSWGRADRWEGDVDMSGPLLDLAPVVAEIPQLAAAFYSDLTDTEWEKNGLLRFDRRTKRFGRDDKASRAAVEAALTVQQMPLVTPRDITAEGVRAITFLPGDAQSIQGRRIEPASRYSQHRVAVAGTGAITFHFDLEASGFPTTATAGHLFLEASAHGGDERVDRPFVGYPWARKPRLLAGDLDYRIRLQGPHLRHETSLPSFAQSDADAWPTVLTVTANGMVLGTRRLADDWATADGVLSRATGLLPGAHGEAVRLDFTAETWATVLRQAEQGELRLELAFAPPPDEIGGGLTLYGAALGAEATPLAFCFADGHGTSRSAIPRRPLWDGSATSPAIWAVRRAPAGTTAGNEVARSVTTFAAWPGRTLRPPAQQLALLDLGAAFPDTPRDGEAELVTWVHLPEGREVSIWTGATDAWRLDVTRADGLALPYLGNPHTWHGVRPDSKMGTYSLVAGWTEIRLSSRRKHGAAWQLTFQLTDADGQVIPGLKWSTQAPSGPPAP